MAGNNKNTVFFTGGHGGSAAYAVIEKLVGKDIDIHWIGPKYAYEDKKYLSFEFRSFPKLGVTCHAIRSGRIHRKFGKNTIVSFFKLPLGFLAAMKIVFFKRPKLVVSFGGFAAFPVVFAAKIMGSRVFIHEQTVGAGLSNKVSSFFADRIFLARKSSLKYFPRKKSVLVGNPVRWSVLSIKPKTRISSPPVILVTCGSRGSQVVNAALKPILRDILEHYRLIHQTGDPDYKEIELIRSTLDPKFRKRYEIYRFLDPDLMASFLDESDIVVSRAGANTVSELIIAGRLSILIPIPWVQRNEQFKNAKLMAKCKLGVILKQEELTSESLLKTINDLFENWHSMVSRTRKLDLGDRTASEKISKEILNAIKK